LPGNDEDPKPGTKGQKETHEHREPAGDGKNELSDGKLGLGSQNEVTGQENQGTESQVTVMFDVDSNKVVIELSGAFDLESDDVIIFAIIEDHLNDYLESIFGPVIESFKLFIDFRMKPNTSTVSAATGSTPTVALADVSVRLHVSSDDPATLSDVNPETATEALENFFLGATLQDLLNALLNGGFDIADLQLDGNFGLEEDLGDLAISAQDTLDDEGKNKSSAGIIAGAVGGAAILVALAAVALKRRNRRVRVGHEGGMEVDDEGGNLEEPTKEATGHSIQYVSEELLDAPDMTDQESRGSHRSDDESLFVETANGSDSVATTTRMDSKQDEDVMYSIDI
jgi:hypothetical protein